MTSIKEEEVLHVARLARLKLSPEELRLCREQLGEVLSHMQELRGLELLGAALAREAPAAGQRGPAAAASALRKDEPASCDCAQGILENAPAREGPYFKVPKVLP